MNNAQAFAMGEANRYKELMVFDWDKAAQIIKEKQPLMAAAGLKDDWEWTGGYIFESGKPVKDWTTYLSSTWAKPQLKLYYNDVDDDEYFSLSNETIDCYKMQSETPGWKSDTKWPQSALAILGKQVSEDEQENN